MINLDIIVEALEMTDNETEFFFDREKNDVISALTNARL